MKYTILLFCFLGALIWGIADGLMSVKDSLWYLIPVVGYAIGLWYSLKFLVRIVKNLDKMHLFINILKNLTFLAESSTSQKQEFKKLLGLLAEDPGRFKRRYS